jgi:hypothetical protein
LLLPDSVTRQSFVLTDLNGNGYDIPTIAYDPVARSVSMQTLNPLPPCQGFRVYLLTPAESQGVGGLQSIDGATLDPSTPQYIEFPVTGTCATGGDGGAEAAADGGPAADAGSDAGEAGTAPVAMGPRIDFCGTVLPIFENACSSTTCHGGASPAAGLRLDSSQGVLDTAINRVSIESNQGPRSLSEPASQQFGLDMPIIDGTGTQGGPGDSWLVYKLMLATPPSSTPATNFHSRPWSAISATERTTLANYIIGTEMPFPAIPGKPDGTNIGPLSLDQMEQISFWIQQGAPVPPCAE